MNVEYEISMLGLLVSGLGLAISKGLWKFLWILLMARYLVMSVRAHVRKRVEEVMG